MNNDIGNVLNIGTEWGNGSEKIKPRTHFDMWDKKKGLPRPSFQRSFVNCLALYNQMKKNANTENSKDISLNSKDISFDISNAEILKVTATNLSKWWHKVVDRLLECCEFLHTKCGVIYLNHLPYQYRILPLFTAFYCIEGYKSKEREIAKLKMEYWYWLTLFLGEYRERQREVALRHANQLRRWIAGDSCPFQNINATGTEEKILGASGYLDEDTLIHGDCWNKEEETIKHDASDRNINVNPNISRAIWQYVLSTSPHDFSKPGTSINFTTKELAKKIDSRRNAEEHHIFPKVIYNERIGKAKNEKLDKKHPINSPLNQMYVTREANKFAAADHDRYFKQYDKYCKKDYFSGKINRFEGSSADGVLYRFLKNRHETIQASIVITLKSLLQEIEKQEQ